MHGKQVYEERAEPAAEIRALLIRKHLLFIFTRHSL
jgi:hypothetical protein